MSQLADQRTESTGLKAGEDGMGHGRATKVLSLFRFDGHHRCGGQAASAVSYSAGLR